MKKTKKRRQTACGIELILKTKIMKVKLLKKLRQIGRNKITIHSITTTNGTVSGMKYGYDFDEYSGLFNYGNTEKDVKEKACKIYLEMNIGYLRKRYAKYSVKYKR